MGDKISISFLIHLTIQKHTHIIQIIKIKQIISSLNFLQKTYVSLLFYTFKKLHNFTYKINIIKNKSDKITKKYILEHHQLSLSFKNNLS